MVGWAFHYPYLASLFGYLSFGVINTEYSAIKDQVQQQSFCVSIM